MVIAISGDIFGIAAANHIVVKPAIDHAGTFPFSQMQSASCCQPEIFLLLSRRSAENLLTYIFPLGNLFVQCRQNQKRQFFLYDIEDNKLILGNIFGSRDKRFPLAKRLMTSASSTISVIFPAIRNHF